MRRHSYTVRPVTVGGLLAILITTVVAVSWAQQPTDGKPSIGQKEFHKYLQQSEAWREQKVQVDLAFLQAQVQAKEADFLIFKAHAEVKKAEIHKANAERLLLQLAPSQAIYAALEKPIPLHFPNETPLEDVLKFIKQATAGPDDGGIPIYVDPVGLQEAGKTMVSPVTIDVEGAPLGTTLRLVLKQIGLTYNVDYGLLKISSDGGGGFQ